MSDKLPSAFDRLQDPFVRALTPEAARALIEMHADADTQARVDELADKCTEGQLSAEERTEYKDFVDVNNLIAILKAKVRKRLAEPPH